MIPFRLRTASVALASLALLAGCGGGGGEETVSKAEFIKHADGICERMDNRLVAKLEALGRSFPATARGSSKAVEIAKEKFLRTVALSEIQKEAEAVAALPAPERDEKKVKQFASEIELAVREAEKGAVTPIFTSEDRGRFQRVYKLGAAYGFKVCKEAL